jgi:hypothetical protein
MLNRKGKPMNVCKQKIKDRIAELEAELADVSDEQIEASNNDRNRWHELLNMALLERELTEEEKAEFRSLDTKTATLQDELNNFRETLATPLMQAFTKFILTNTPKLVSPAGYHPDEKVFVQTEVAVHYNDRLPYVGYDGDLYVHQVDGFIQV